MFPQTTGNSPKCRFGRFEETEVSKAPLLRLARHLSSVDPMQKALLAGGIYFAGVFPAGFALGTLRVLVLAPRLGELVAVLAELPFMLGIAWLFCGWLVGHLRIPRQVGPRLAMGALGFGLLMVAEIALSTLLFGLSLPEFLAALVTPEGAIGLAGQVLFGLMPLLRR